MTTSTAPQPVNPIAKAWGDEVLYRRTKLLGLTQSQLAELVDVHQTIISKIEQGRIVPSPRVQRRLIDVCRMDDRTVVRLVRGAA